MRLSVVLCVAMAGCALPSLTPQTKETAVTQALTDQLDSGGQVSVALVCSVEAPLSGKNYQSKKIDPEQLKRSVCRQALDSTEQWMLERYGKKKNFLLVDRFATQKILADSPPRDSMELIVSQKLRSELGETLGATHIMFIHETLEEDDGVMVRTIIEARNLRLMDVKTGAVLATESHEYRSWAPY